jgi:hypothetical protein
VSLIAAPVARLNVAWRVALVSNGVCQSPLKYVAFIPTSTTLGSSGSLSIVGILPRVAEEPHALIASIACVVSSFSVRTSAPKNRWFALTKSGSIRNWLSTQTESATDIVTSRLALSRASRFA